MGARLPDRTQGRVRPAWSPPRAHALDMDSSSPRQHGTGTAGRLRAYDWGRIDADLAGDGVAVLPALLQPDECSALASLYDDADAGTFRSRVIMARHGFGRGEYQYFDYPLPRLIAE